MPTQVSQPSANRDEDILRDIPLFASLEQKHRYALQTACAVQTFAAGETIVTEGASSDQRLFLILEGDVGLFKGARSLLSADVQIYEIEVRSRSDIFGAMWVLDDNPLPVSVMAKTPVTVAILDLAPDSPRRLPPNLRNIVTVQLRRYLANYARLHTIDRAQSLAKEAEFGRYLGAVGAIIIAALILLSIYTLALGTLPRFEKYIGVNFALSPFIIVFFALIFFPVIRRSGFPPAFFGLRLDNRRPALAFSATVSLGFIAACVAIKWLAIETVPSLHGMSVVSFADVRIGDELTMMSRLYWIAAGLYLLLTPVQEFVARCGIQAPLYAFLQGSEWRRRVVSISVSNLVFSAAHAHIGLTFAIAAFLPGLFWGWIFARTNSLLAASVSHLMIGGAGIFIFGIQEFVQKLF